MSIKLFLPAATPATSPKKTLQATPALLVMLFAALVSVVIASCYDGDTSTTTTGERVRLACIDTPELVGERAEPVTARAARDHLETTSRPPEQSCGGQEGWNPMKPRTEGVTGVPCGRVYT